MKNPAIENRKSKIENRKLVLVDGNALVHRAYHALPPLTTSQGEMTSAVFGFTSMLLKVLAEEKPDYVAVAWDVGKSFRHEEFAAYKATRPKMAEELAGQFARVRQVVDALGIPSFGLAGYEADDLVGTLAKQAGAQSVQTIIVTGDTDALQLVDEHTRVLTSRGHFSDTVVYDEAAVRERYGLEPEQLADLRGLKGDVTDNIPGIPGVGEVTAKKLLAQFGRVESVFQRLDEMEPKLRDKIAPYAEQAVNSKRLATIVTDAPIQLDLAACRLHAYDRDKALALFRELEFRSLVNRLPEQRSRGAEERGSTPAPQHPSTPALLQPQQMALFGEEAPPAPAAPPEPLVQWGKSFGAPSAIVPTQVVDTTEALTALARRLAAAGRFVLDTETTSQSAMQAGLVGLSIAVDGNEAFYVPVAHREGRQLPQETVFAHLRPLLEDEYIAKTAHNANYDLLMLANHGLTVRGLECDTMIAAYLLGEKAASLKDLAFTKLGVTMTPITDLIGKGAKQITMAAVPIADAAAYAGADAAMTYRLRQTFEPELRRQNLWSLFAEVEMPLVPVLVQMERDGVALDVPFLQALSREMFQRLAALEEQIYAAVGHRFNINSTQQLAGVLFEELKLPKIKRTATGYSTDSSVLEELRGSHPIIDALLEQRQIAKLKSTYVDALPLLVNPKTGRVHTSYNQAVTTTGRLSSSDPNLQNIPIRSELGRQVRRAFIAQGDNLLLSADYSQVELRILAHISQDKNLLAAFAAGEDIHAATASFLFGVPIEQVTPAQRRLGKTINFGVTYGMGDYGLAQRTELDQAEASKYIKDYFARYPDVKRYLEETKRLAREQGYVTTLMGRRRYLPELKAVNRGLVAAGERMAINMPVQGCLPYTTRVLTSEGFRFIGDLWHMDCSPLQIWTGTNFAPFQVVSRGPCELAELILENGRILRCDTRHEVLVVNEDSYKFKHYRDLASGDRICLSMPQEIEFGSPPTVNYQYVPRVHNGKRLAIDTLDHSFFYWLGFYYGDGCLASDPTRWVLLFSIGARSGHFTIDEKVAECMHYFDSLGLGARARQESPSKAAVVVYSKGLVELLERIGVTREGQAATKRVPTIVFSSPLAMRKAFLQGILDSNGYAGGHGATTPNIHLCQKPLLDDLWLLFRTTGVEGKIRGPYTYKEGQSYRLDLVGGMLEPSVGFSGRSVVKIPQMVAPAFLVAAFLDTVSPKQLNNHSHKVLHSRLRHGGTTSIYSIAEMVKAARTCLPIPIYTWSPLKEKRNLGFQEETFTIIVDDSGHRFDSEGVISKNTAADIIKIAMVRLHRDMAGQGLRSKMILQVHDELVFEVPPAELETMKPLVKELMEGPLKLDAPLKVDLKVGRNWEEMV